MRTIRRIGMDSLFRWILAITFSFSPEAVSASSNFVRVNLPKGVTVELPKNWVVMSANERTTLGAWNEAHLEAKKITDIENDLGFAATYYDEQRRTAATFAIRYYPTLVMTQSEVGAYSAEETKQFDAGLRQTFTKGFESTGGKVVAWLGTMKRNINGAVFLISENRQLLPNQARFRAQLVRLLDAGNSFTIMISYREDQEFFLRPICEKIINSVRVK